MANVELERLTYIAKEAPVTQTPGDLTARALGIPYKLKGARVLDICSGLSSFPLLLRERGAQVTALDIGYANVDALLDRSKLTLSKLMIKKQLFNQ